MLKGSTAEVSKPTSHPQHQPFSQDKSETTRVRLGLQICQLHCTVLGMHATDPTRLRVQVQLTPERVLETLFHDH